MFVRPPSGFAATALVVIRPQMAGEDYRVSGTAAPCYRIHPNRSLNPEVSVMSDKSPRQSASKKSEKSIKQTRAVKKAKKAAVEKSG